MTMREADNLITPKSNNPYDGATHSPSSSDFNNNGSADNKAFGETVIDVGQYTERQLVTMVEDRDRRIEILERRVNELVVIAREPNWPPFYGIVYVDIDQEIPSRRRKYMKFLLYGYYFTNIVLIYNCLGLFIANSFKDKGTGSGGSAWEQGQWLSLAISIIGPVVAFPLWFYTSYRAVSSGQTVKYFISIAGVGIGLLGSIFALIGIVGMGFSGVIVMITAFDKKASAMAGLILLGGVIGWGLQCLLMIFALVWQVRYYRKDYSITQLVKFAAKEALAEQRR